MKPLTILMLYLHSLMDLIVKRDHFLLKLKERKRKNFLVWQWFKNYKLNSNNWNYFTMTKRQVWMLLNKNLPVWKLIILKLSKLLKNYVKKSKEETHLLKLKLCLL